ncbi:MAG TPA: hypothetical protein RMH99_02170 [Sandaracinaceae bacterium LLY-WYZ-13_1]|nr:hypothetical protein [Sandaracinaceae bacterium LLY-WYZ-13_1]
MSTLFGVNVPYLGGEYGHDLAENPRFPTWPCRFDPMLAYGPLIEARRLGFRAVRMWLCENGEGIRLDDGGAIVGVSERLVESVKVVQEAAHLHGLYLYWNLLDGNAWPREGDPVTRSILADADQAARFAEHVVAPLAAVFDPERTLGIDVVNEPESSTAACIGDDAVTPVAWASIGRALRLSGRAARAERELLVTAGSAMAFLPELWRAEAELTAVDLHVYHRHGGLPSREDLARYVEDDALMDPALPLIAGELGIPKDPGPDEPRSLCNYLHNAERLGYAAAFLWQLEGDLVDKSRDERPFTWLGGQVQAVLAQLHGDA